VWSAIFTWAEREFDGVGNLMGVACWIRTRIDERKKVIVSKGDNLEKHEGKRVCKVNGVPYPRLEVGDFYIKKDCKHLRNQALWSACQSAPTVIQQVIRGCQAETNIKEVQFSTLFQVLCNGRPMVDYCKTQHLLRHLNVKNLPKKHWCKTSGWEMSEHIESMVLHALKTLLKGSRILSLSVDEVTAIDMTCWISVHVHIMEGWERVPHLLHISYVSEPDTADHLIE
jgi:hypothetical protein